MRSRNAVAAQWKRTIAIMDSDNANAERQKLVEALRGHVWSLAHGIGERNVFRPQALHAAENYLRRAWQDMGYEVNAQDYEVEGVRCANLEVEIPGSRDRNQAIVLGAHYDSVAGSPGANDNASGVASLLELARLCRRGAPRARSLRFVAFVNEEPPFFWTAHQGSMRYAAAARARGDDIRFMLSLETIGYYRSEPGSQRYPPLLQFFYPDRGNFIAFVSNRKSRQQLRSLTAAFRESCAFPLESAAIFSWVPGVAWSDHASFWRHGYRAAMVTDTALYRYPYYHSPQDTAEKLDYESLATVTLGLVHAIHRLLEQGP